MQTSYSFCTSLTLIHIPVWISVQHFWFIHFWWYSTLYSKFNFCDWIPRFCLVTHCGNHRALVKCKSELFLAVFQSLICIQAKALCRSVTVKTGNWAERLSRVCLLSLVAILMLCPAGWVYKCERPKLKFRSLKVSHTLEGTDVLVHPIISLRFILRSHHNSVCQSLFGIEFANITLTNNGISQLQSLFYVAANLFRPVFLSA